MFDHLRTWSYVRKPQGADSWLLGIIPTSDEEMAWRASMTAVEAQALYRKAKAPAEARVAMPEGRPTWIRDSSPTLQMRQPQWGGAAKGTAAEGVTAPYLATAVPFRMTPAAEEVQMEGLTVHSEEEVVVFTQAASAASVGVAEMIQAVNAGSGGDEGHTRHEGIKAACDGGDEGREGDCGPRQKGA